MLQPSSKSAAESFVPYLRAAHVQGNGRLDLTVDQKEMWASAHDQESLDLRAGDVLVVEGGAVGRSVVLESHMPGVIFQNALIRLRPNTRSDGRYLNYCLQSAVSSGEIDALCSSVSIAHFTAEKVGRFRIPEHDHATQQRIADYLDRETGEIDAMIAKLDQLVETLVVRRTDAMVHALASTTSIAVGLLAEVTLGNMLRSTPQSDSDVLRPYLRAAHVQPKGVLDLSVPAHEMWFSPADAEKLTLRRGDVVVVEGGVGGYGRAAFVTEDIEDYGFQNSIIRLRGETADDGRYLAHALVAARNTGQIELACLNVAMPHFTAEKVTRFRVPFHEASERVRIADHLDEVTGKIDAMLTKTAELKARLLERRSALITDVVTGRKEVA